MPKINYEKLRMQKGLSREDLALKVGCSVPTIRLIEKGITKTGRHKEAIEKILLEKEKTDVNN